nr:hypothetical protein [Helicobacter sp. UBA3407]
MSITSIAMAESLKLPYRAIFANNCEKHSSTKSNNKKCFYFLLQYHRIV